MNLPHVFAVAAIAGMLSVPASAAEAKSKKMDPAIECGAFFILMAEQADNAEDAKVFSDMGNLLLNDVDTRLSSMGVSLEERQRIGGDAVTRVNEQMNSGDIRISFANCHVAMENAVDAAMPNLLSSDARELLTCGSQFIYSLQSGEFDEETNANFEAASDDQMARAQADMEEAGATEEEQGQISTFFGLSVGMVLGMGEDPVISWERCGEI